MRTVSDHRERSTGWTLQGSRLRALAQFALMALLALLPLSDTRAQTAQTQQVMRQKLALSQQALAGLVRSDWGALAASSRALSALTRDPGWAVLREPEYVKKTTDFLASVDALTAAATRRNQTGALSAYNQLVASCVQCHQYVARARIARR